MTGAMIDLKAEDGFDLQAYRADPMGAPRAGLVVLQELFGVNRHIRSVADGFAREGYQVVAPALFDRVERQVELGYGPDDLKRGQELRVKISMDKTLADIAAAVKAVQGAGKVGIVGYCWGGLLAFLAAGRLQGVSAAVAYYGGRIADNLQSTPNIPIMMHFGDQDRNIPLTDVEKIRQAYPDIAVHVYSANHGFNCDDRSAYDKASADKARERTLAFLSQHLS